MTKTAEQVLQQAMALQPADRIELAERLLEAGGESTEVSDDPEYLAAWEAEINRRLEDIDAGRGSRRITRGTADAKGDE